MELDKFFRHKRYFPVSVACAKRAQWDDSRAAYDDLLGDTEPAAPQPEQQELDLQLSQATDLGRALRLPVRCAEAAVLLALGLTRAEAAATLRINEHTVKSDLKILFERFQLRSGIDLSRLITEEARQIRRDAPGARKE